jgi:hypothetical protein
MAEMARNRKSLGMGSDMAKANGNSTGKSANRVMPMDKKKKLFIYHSKQKVVTSPEEVKTWAEAVDKVMRNYNEAWERLAKE